MGLSKESADAANDCECNECEKCEQARQAYADSLEAIGKVALQKAKVIRGY